MTTGILADPFWALMVGLALGLAAGFITGFITGRDW